MEFSKILKNLMEEKNLNQSQLAIKINVKQSQISEWLNGKSKPGYDNLKALCMGLKVSADELLGIIEY